MSAHLANVLVVAGLGNPMGTQWVYGLKSLGFNTVVLDNRKSPVPLELLDDWGLRDDIPVFNFENGTSAGQRQTTIVSALGGEPDILFGWWGSPILGPLHEACRLFPEAKVALCVDTLPNAASIFSELREIWRFRKADPWIDSYVFYSEAMRKLFNRRIPSSRGKPYLTLVEPFLKRAFDVGRVSDTGADKLERLDDNPHVIFTGRGDKLWSKDLRFAKDALGPFLARLAECGVHVFVPQTADSRVLPDNLHLYPFFSNRALFEGRFARYVSQFDAHLVLYNESNGTIRRRVSTGLSTRLAFALAATAPVALTRTCSFIEEYWGEDPFGLVFSDVGDLVASLRDKRLLTTLRSNMEKVHISHTFEAQKERIVRFLVQLLGEGRTR
jgi:hypothetical protein